MYNNNSNRELPINYDQESVHSFDSSQVLSLQTRTASITSDCTIQKREGLQTSITKKDQFQDNLSQRTLSIQKPRFEVQQAQLIFQQEVPFQLGFVMGKNKKSIDPNKSKLKRVRNFFDDQQTTQTTFKFNQDLFPNYSLMQFPRLNPIQQFKEQMPEFSIPCFKNLGKNHNVPINQDFLLKAKGFFNDDFQKNEQLSFKKPTKVKKSFDYELQKQSNFIRTVNVNKNRKKYDTNIVKKQIFDWNKFQLSSKKLSCRKLETSTKSKQKNKSNTKNKKFKVQKQKFLIIALKDLQVKQFQNQSKLQLLQNRRCQASELTFKHCNFECNIHKCLLCSLSVDDDQLDLGKLENIFSTKLIMQKIQTLKFYQLYEQICFKLLKYEIFFPEIVNKRLNPSNIFVQMHKKSKLIETGALTLGWLDLCLKQSKFYHSFIAVVKEIYHNQKIKTYFVQLSDGWTNVWTIITQKNYLYNYINKLKICTKIFIGYWRVYSLANILTFCPKSKVGQKCIQIWYNSSIIVKEDSRIGKPNNLIFYRPLRLCRKEGGIVPTVQGTIIRMFCPFSAKKKSINASNDNTFSENFVQIITPEGYTVFIRFVLPSDRSLAQLFRLYFKYQFYFLKIGGKDSILQFNDESSKSFEFQKKQKNSYPPQLIKIIKGRFINAMNNDKIIGELKVGNLYDIRLQNDQNRICGFKFTIENDSQIDITNSSCKNAAFLYQQYRLQRVQSVDKEKRGDIRFYLKKYRYSNILKSLPTVYEKLNQFV